MLSRITKVLALSAVIAILGCSQASSGPSQSDIDKVKKGIEEEIGGGGPTMGADTEAKDATGTDAQAK